MSKYRNKKIEVDGITFDSLREAKYYQDFKLLERAGEISRLEVHPKFPLMVNGVKIGRYEADFAFQERDGRKRIIDVKSPVSAKLPVFRLKKKILEAMNPAIEVEVVL